MDYHTYDLFLSSHNIEDNSEKTLSEYKQAIKSLISEDLESDILTQLKWDYELLSCCEIPIERRQEGQKYLYPEFVFTDGREIPDIDNFEDERFDFYRHRFESSSNTELKIRYANYFFQYGQKEKRHLYASELCNLVISQIEREPFDHSLTVLVSRLFEVALSFSLQEIIPCFDNILNGIIIRQHNDSDYLWILAIIRISTRNIQRSKKLNISETTRNNIMTILVELIGYYKSCNDYIQYRNCLTVYIDWLHISGCDEQIQENLIKYGETFEQQAESGEQSNLAKASFYEMAARHFADIGEREKVYKLKVKIKQAFRRAQETGEYKTISTTQSIKTSDLENETRDFFGVSISDTFNLFSHSSDFIIKKAPIEQVAEGEANNPIYKLVDFGHVQGNRKVFNAQSEDDLKRHLVCSRYSIHLETTFSVLVNYIWNRMITDGLTANMVSDRICEIEYMDDQQKELITSAINRFFENDYISTLHILVPQFESYFRTLFEWGGFPTTSLKADATQHEQTFNDFLLQQYVKDTIESDLIFMIDFVMVNQLGKNLRNNIAHGLLDIKQFNKTNCIIVIYLFFLITAIRWKFE